MPWDKSLKSMANQIEDDFNEDVERYAHHALNLFIQQSPVGNPSLWKGKAPKGYVGGTFRKDWALDKIPNGWSIYNTQAYAKRLLEEGWSSQVPIRWVDLAISELKAMR